MTIFGSNNIELEGERELSSDVCDNGADRDDLQCQLLLNL